MPTQTPTQPQPAQQPTALDPKIVTLAKAIRQTESNGNFQAKGASGEYGAYQFMGSTWDATAPKYGVSVPLNQATPQQQNEVAYKQLADWSKEHPEWNVGNFASAWNAGPGKPDAYLQGNAGTNSKGVSYDTAAYAQKVATNYQQLKAQDQNGTVPQAPQTQQQAPSVGGFLGNVVSSGANLVGNIGNALLHPINTVENIGGAAVGAAQELGGQTNDNTAKFDNLKNYFTQRYGGVSNVEHSLYTDPVGVLADLSAALGIGGGIAGAVGKAGELGTVADAGRAADLAGETGLRTMAGDTASGNALTRGASTVQNALGTASHYTNPLTPVIAGGSALLGKAGELGKTAASYATNIDRPAINTILEHPQEFTSDAVANYSRADLANEIKDTLDAQIAEKAETGAAQTPIRNALTPLQVSPDFLDSAIRKSAGVDIKDGVIRSSASSAVRDSADIRELQDIYNRYKPSFLDGSMDSNKFLNLRSDLADTANFKKGLSTKLQFAARDIRDELNTQYRSQMPGLEDIDKQYETQSNALKEARKGLIDKDGNLLKTATNRVNRAGNVGQEESLKQLEKIMPGITKRLEIQHAMEQIQHASDVKVGAYTKSVLEGGAVLTGLSTGQLHIVAGAIAFAIASKPAIAVPLMRAFGKSEELTHAVTVNLAKMVNLPNISKAINTASVANAATNGGQQDQSGQQQFPQSSPQIENTGVETPPVDQQNPSQNDITQTPGYQAAIKAGYTPSEISTYLNQQQ